MINISQPSGGGGPGGNGGNGEWLGINSSHIDSFCGQDFQNPLSEGLDGTNWWAHFANEVHWFILDLGASYNITKVKGRSEHIADPIDVDVYVSDSKLDWGTAVATGISTWQDTSVWQEVETTPKNGRYIKVEINDTEDEAEIRTLDWGKIIPTMTIFDVYGSEV